MLVEVEDAQPQDAKLADALTALASPVRLALLRQLRLARALREIKVRPVAATSAGEGADRRGGVMSRQAVREHLDRLLQTGVVSARETLREYGATLEYVLNHQTIFAVAEELRSLARLRPEAELEGATLRGRHAAPAEEPEGPCLVLVKGLDEGQHFPLDPEAEGRAWTIGRRRDLAVPLDFDPYVSTENAVVRLDGEGHVVEGLPDAVNGTTVNFRPLPPGVPRRLRTGDVIGVGRSLLLYRGPS